MLLRPVIFISLVIHRKSIRHRAASASVTYGLEITRRTRTYIITTINSYVAYMRINESTLPPEATGEWRENHQEKRGQNAESEIRPLTPEERKQAEEDFSSIVEEFKQQDADFLARDRKGENTDAVSKYNVYGPESNDGLEMQKVINDLHAVGIDNPTRQDVLNASEVLSGVESGYYTPHEYKKQLYHIVKHKQLAETRTAMGLKQKEVHPIDLDIKKNGAERISRIIEFGKTIDMHDAYLEDNIQTVGDLQTLFQKGRIKLSDAYKYMKGDRAPQITGMLDKMHMLRRAKALGRISDDQAKKFDQLV